MYCLDGCQMTGYLWCEYSEDGFYTKDLCISAYINGVLYLLPVFDTQDKLNICGGV